MNFHHHCAEKLAQGPAHSPRGSTHGYHQPRGQQTLSVFEWPSGSHGAHFLVQRHRVHAPQARRSEQRRGIGLLRDSRVPASRFALHPPLPVAACPKQCRGRVFATHRGRVPNSWHRSSTVGHLLGLQDIQVPFPQSLLEQEVCWKHQCEQR